MIKTIFSSKNKRTLLAKKNIIYSLLLKFIGLFVMFSLIPLSINYLGTVNYGIWITISSILAWLGMFDFGFSNGLRNKLTIAIANNNYEEGKFLVSSTYLFMLITSSILLVILLLIVSFVDWTTLLKIPENYNIDILHLSLIILILFLIFQFTLKPLNSVFQAYQLSSVPQALGTLGGLISLGIVYFLFQMNFMPKLIYYTTAIAGIPVLILFIATMYFFRNRYKMISPSFSFMKINYMKSIGGLGSSFFLIQLSLLIVYSSDNLIISYLFGPEYVTTYNVVFKYFSIITIFFGVIMSPFWSAITDAYAKDDMMWIKNIINKLLLVLLVGSLFAVFLALISTFIFPLWINENFDAPNLLIYLMCIYSIAIAWLNIFSFFSNGIGKIRIQLIVYLIAALVNIPLSYFFAKVLDLGTSGVILATILCVVFICIILTIQYLKIINNKAEGVWIK